MNTFISKSGIHNSSFRVCSTGNGKKPFITCRQVHRRPATGQAGALQVLADTNPRLHPSKVIQTMADNSRQSGPAIRLQAMADDYALEQQPVIQAKQESQGGSNSLSEGLIAGIRALSGHSLHNVALNLNSSIPAGFNAHALTQGNSIHVAPGQEKHIPHEAWHVVQQREGRVKPTMQMKGVDINDDAALEKEADVMGARAEQFQRKAGTSGDHLGNFNNTTKEAPFQLSGDKGILQRKLEVAGQARQQAEPVWDQIVHLEPIRVLDFDQKLQAYKILRRWIHAPIYGIRENVVSEDRKYANWQELAAGIAGALRSQYNLAHETSLAGMVQNSQEINDRIGGLLDRVIRLHSNFFTDEARAGADTYRGHYRIYYGTSRLAFGLNRGKTISQVLRDPPLNLNARIAFLLDYARYARHWATGDPFWRVEFPDNLREARLNHWNPNESKEWTKQARSNFVPLGSGPSASTALVMTLGRFYIADPLEMQALAWGVFSFFNQGLHLNHSGTHRFHEVMSVASLYGVPYNPWIYPYTIP